MTTMNQPATPAPNTDRLATSPRRAAIIAGIGFVILFALGIVANFVVREGLMVAGDAAQTAENIRGSEGLFRIGMVAFMVIFIVDVVVAWALFVLFRPVHRDLSLLTAWFRIVYTVLLGVAIAFFFQALQFLGRGEFLDAFTGEQLDAQALVALDTFNSAWLIGLLAFGIHLVLLGVLVLRSRWTPRALGYVLVAAGLAYVVDTVANTMLANYADYGVVFAGIVAVFAVVGEGWFGVWLLVRGGKGVVTPTVDREVSALHR